MTFLSGAFPDADGATSGFLIACNRAACPQLTSAATGGIAAGGAPAMPAEYSTPMATLQYTRVGLLLAGGCITVLASAWDVSQQRTECAAVVEKLLSAFIGPLQALRYLQLHPAATMLGGPWQVGGVDPRAVVQSVLQPPDLGTSEFAVVVSRAAKRLFNVALPVGMLHSLSYYSSAVRDNLANGFFGPSPFRTCHSLYLAQLVHPSFLPLAILVA
eukprot:1799344-Amphidinium_carterae.4